MLESTPKQTSYRDFLNDALLDGNSKWLILGCMGLNCIPDKEEYTTAKLPC